MNSPKFDLRYHPYARGTRRPEWKDPAINPHELASQESAFELLARQTDTPVEAVFKIYSLERAKLEEVARIKTYIPVLIHRRVKELLQTQGTV